MTSKLVYAQKIFKLSRVISLGDVQMDVEIRMSGTTCLDIYAASLSWSSQFFLRYLISCLFENRQLPAGFDTTETLLGFQHAGIVVGHARSLAGSQCGRQFVESVLERKSNKL